MSHLYKNELLDKYCEEFTSRIVSETGISSDKYHFGKIILQGLKDDPDFVLQIDGGTGESETNGSVLKRSIQCATSFRNMGLRTGDVMILMAPHHLDQAIPMYAALYLGITTAAIDITYVVDELKNTFNTSKPKIIFCQSEKVEDVQKAIGLLGLDTRVISFDKSPNTMGFAEMMEKYGDDNVTVQDFECAYFNPVETIAFLIATSGTTGLPKAAALSHQDFAISGPYICDLGTKFPSPIRSSMLVAPLQWLSAILNYIISPYLKFTRIQSSAAMSPEHIFELINKYKPTFMVISPTMMTTLVKAAAEGNACDFSCFKILYLGGSAVPQLLVEELKSLANNAIVTDAYGMSETGSILFHSIGFPVGSCGKPFSHIQYKLVNTETGAEITEPNQHGELWVKTPGGFIGYYNNPEATTETLSKDGWFMTGDMMYRDEDWNFFFVDRIKLLLKYETLQISPVEIESVIRQHPGVLDVAVTGIPDPERGDLPVACIIPRTGVQVTAQEIQDLVKEKLTDYKQLRGGIIFMNELPLTTSTKVHRRKLKEMVIARTNGRQ